MASDALTHELLWTGGWDSTYRLLEILLIQKAAVNLHYIAFPSRKSTQMEIKTMSKILRAIKTQYPETKDKISPLKITLEDDISIDDKFFSAFDLYNSLYHKLGDQYPIIAGYCEYTGLDNLELSIESATDMRFNYLTDPLLENSQFQDNGHYFFMPSPPDELLLFKDCRFPLLKKTKYDMLAMAEQHGFSNILKMSWFCHHPVKDKPCGHCSPCGLVMLEKMQWRIPLKQRLLRPLNRLKKAIKSKKKALKNRLGQ